MKAKKNKHKFLLSNSMERSKRRGSCHLPMSSCKHRHKPHLNTITQSERNPLNGKRNITAAVEAGDQGDVGTEAVSLCREANTQTRACAHTHTHNGAVLIKGNFHGRQESLRSPM